MNIFDNPNSHILGAAPMKWHIAHKQNDKIVNKAQIFDFCAIFFNFSIDECGFFGYNNYSVIYGSRMFNTRFVVSFLLFYTKIWFHFICTDRRDVFPAIFFAHWQKKRHTADKNRLPAG